MNDPASRAETELSRSARCADQIVGFLIGGTLWQSSSESTVDVIDPSTGTRCLSIPAGSTIDVDRAIASVRRAFDDGRWCGEAPLLFRKKILHRVADLIAPNQLAVRHRCGGGGIGSLESYMCWQLRQRSHA